MEGSAGADVTSSSEGGLRNDTSNLHSMRVYRLVVLVACVLAAGSSLRYPAEAAVETTEVLLRVNGLVAAAR